MIIGVTPRMWRLKSQTRSESSGKEASGASGADLVKDVALLVRRGLLHRFKMNVVVAESAWRARGVRDEGAGPRGDGPRGL